MSRALAGRAILDNSCLGALTAPGVLERFERSLRTVDFQVWPSVVNVMEGFVTPAKHVRRRLLHTLIQLLDGRHLLPWPFTLLASFGQALQEGEDQLWIRRSKFELLLERPEDLEVSRDALMAKMHDMEEQYEQDWLEVRRKVRPLLRSERSEDLWSDLPSFLDEQWNKPDLFDHSARVMWDRLSLRGDPPVERLRDCELWRMFHDIEGIAMFERAVQLEQPKRVHRFDLLQIPYLAMWHKRVLITNDGPFARAAQAMLLRRYPNTRVVKLQVVLDGA